MKKKIVGIIVFMIGFLWPISGKALDFNPKLYCDGKILKSKEATCNVKADLNGFNLKSYDIEITVSDNLKVGNSRIEGSAVEEGTSKSLATFKVTGENKGTGTVTIKVTNIVAQVNDVEESLANCDVESEKVTVIEENNDLSSLTVDNKTVPNFSKSNLNYNVTTAKSTIKVGATATDSNSKITGLGNHKLICGNNLVEVTVNNNKTYSINVTRECNSDAKLKNITVSNGTLTPSFKENVTEYSVEVSKEIEKIAIGYEKKDDTQTVTGAGSKTLEFGKNNFKVVSKASDGTTITYTITIVREDNRSTNDYLANLELSEGNILFDKETLNYEVKVLNDITKLDIKATPEDADAKVEITGNDKLKVGENKVVVKVTSEKGNIREYVINVIRLDEGETLGDNPNIASLIVEGYDLGFTTNKQNYKLKIKDETSLTISVVMEDENSTYTIVGNKDLKNGSIITINTLSQDGSQGIYHINIEKDSLLPIILIMIAICIVVIIVLIVVLIKLKKNKRKTPKTTIIDNDLLARVDRQLKNASKANTNGKENNNQNEKTDELKKVVKENRKVEQVKPRIEPTPPKKEFVKPQDIDYNQMMNKPEQTTNNNRQPKQDQPSYYNHQTNFNSNQKETTEETKICSICGHRVPVSSTVCPYCKRKF